MIHYDVQLIGGMVLHDGKVAEMATGEGKTLVATLPGYLNGLAGRGVHIVTVNDFWPNVTQSGWVLFINSCFLRWIVLTITDHTLRNGRKRIKVILLLEPTMSLDLII